MLSVEPVAHNEVLMKLPLPSVACIVTPARVVTWLVCWEVRVGGTRS